MTIQHSQMGEVMGCTFIFHYEDATGHLTEIEYDNIAARKDITVTCVDGATTFTVLLQSGTSGTKTVTETIDYDVATITFSASPPTGE